MAPRMLKHKETGELFIYTSLLAKNEFLEPVVDDPVQVVLSASNVAGEASNASNTNASNTNTEPPVSGTDGSEVVTGVVAEPPVSGTDGAEVVTGSVAEATVTSTKPASSKKQTAVV